MRNNIKISFEQPEYVVDENNGVVICKLKFKIDAPALCKLTTGCINWGTSWFLNHISKGVAFAKDTDKFDISVGKKVALAKAENQAYAYVNKLSNDAKKKLVNSVAACIDFENKVKRVRDHNVEYMKKF